MGDPDGSQDILATHLLRRRPLGRSRTVLLIRPFMGPVASWGYQLAPPGRKEEAESSTYGRYGSCRASIGRVGPPGGDRLGGGAYDAEQGCYVLTAFGGNCRFVFVPSRGGELNPVFRVYGPFTGAVTASSAGMAIRELVNLDDGSVLFVLPGLVRRPIAVEVASQPAGG